LSAYFGDGWLNAPGIYAFSGNMNTFTAAFDRYLVDSGDSAACFDERRVLRDAWH